MKRESTFLTNGFPHVLSIDVTDKSGQTYGFPHNEENNVTLKYLIVMQFLTSLIL